MSAYAKIIKDSISTDGVRLSTMEVRFHRFVLAEFNTHRVFSRNSASSRAIPLKKQLAILDKIGPALPVSWPAEQPGMQGGKEVEDALAHDMRGAWNTAARGAAKIAEALNNAGLHKSVVNRLLEPFMWHTVVVTSTAWQNFLEQRCNPDAQPEIREAAELMLDQYDLSTPQIVLSHDWHLPYMDMETADEVQHDSRLLTKISAARCARVSYLSQDGVRDISKDIELYDRLTQNGHWSPLEHVATPWAQNRQNDYSRGLDFNGVDGVNRFVDTKHLPRVGNFLGWRQLRTEVEAEQGKVTFR